MAGKRLALIIGNSKYKDNKLSRLAAPEVDVNELADVLKDSQIGNFDHVNTIINDSLSVVREEIARFFSKRMRDDLLLLYFSGHGLLDENGRLFLAVTDTKHEVLRGTAIEASFITDEMNNSRSRRQVLILDCCHSGAFTRGTKGVGANVGTAAAFEGTGYGRIVLTATDSTQYAWEGDMVVGEAETSLFTHFLLQGLQSGVADSNLDGVVTLDELYEFVYERVIDSTPNQTPGKWSFKQQGEIIIAQNPYLPEETGETPDDLYLLINSPVVGARLGAVYELESLLNSRDETIKGEARDQLEKLTDDENESVGQAASNVLKNWGTEQEQTEIETFDVEKEITDYYVEEEEILPQEKQVRKSNQLLFLAGGLGLIAIIILVGFGIYSILSVNGSIPGAEINAAATADEATRSEALMNKSATEIVAASVLEETATQTTDSPLATSTSQIQLPGPNSDGSKVQMALIPGGTFMMGSEDGRDSEQPVNEIYLDEFYIDIYEVTNAKYAECVSHGGCDPPGKSGTITRDSYFGDPDYEDYPVIYVSWEDANNFCQWAGKRLPMEAEWEKAARGSDERSFPWGEEFDCSKGNFDDELEIDEYLVQGGEGCDGYVESSPVGSFPDGASPYGVFDLAGNVWEFVADWYDYNHYREISSNNPSGPASGESRVLRGGSWDNQSDLSRLTTRGYYDPSEKSSKIGFRCAYTSKDIENNPPTGTINVSETVTPP